MFQKVFFLAQEQLVVVKVTEKDIISKLQENINKSSTYFSKLQTDVVSIPTMDKLLYSWKVRNYLTSGNSGINVNNCKMFNNYFLKGEST